MSKRKVILVICLVVFLLCVLNVEAVQILRQKAVSTQANDSAIVVTVNGTKIYEDKILRIAKYRAEETSQSNPDYERARKVVIGEMIFTELILQKAKEKHVSVSDQELKDAISKWERTPYDELKKNENFKGDFSELERTIKAQILFRKLVLKESTKKIEPTEEQMKKFYKENINFFQEKTEYRIQSIDFWPDNNNPNLTEAKCKERAEFILQKIRNGADFNEMYNIETEAHVRRLLVKSGMKPRESNIEKNKVDKLTDAHLYWNPELKKAILSLKPGQISEVLTLKRLGSKDANDIHFSIIRFIEKIEGTTQSYEEVKDKLRQYVSNQLQEKAINEYNQKLLLEADIKFTNKEDDWRSSGENDSTKGPNIKN